MTILLTIPTLKQGGAERVMSELANMWVENHTVHLVLLASSENFYEIADKVIIHNLGFVNNGKISKVISTIETIVKLRRLFKNVQPDFILSLMIKSNISTLLASFFLGQRVFVSDRSNPRRVQPKIISFLRKLTYRHASGIIAQTTLAKEILTDTTGNKNITVISNPVRKINLIENVKKEKIILNIGRMIPEKGQKYLLEAFSKINSSGWKIVLLGDGPLFDTLKKQAQELGISDRLEMPGTVMDVDKWLSIASIFVFPSISEGFPNGLSEAMAAGLPCISFDCDAGPRNLIRNEENGFLIPVGDVDILTSRLELLIKEPKIREKLSIEAKKIADDLEKSKIADKFLAFCSSNKETINDR